MSKIEKAYAITDAKISFVSLVDKAANKKQFLITKAEHGSASFASFFKSLTNAPFLFRPYCNRIWNGRGGF